MTQTTKEAPTTNIINPKCIILYICSTISSVRNNNLAQNVQPCDAGEELRASTNGGHQNYDHTATLKNLPFGVFLNEQSLSNILLFDAVESKFRITIDTELDPSINIHLNYGTRVIFKQCGAGIYYFDTTNKDFEEDKTIDYKFLNAVYSNKSCFHRQEIKGPDEAIILQQLL